MYFKHSGVLIGLVDGPLYEKDVRKQNWVHVKSKIATHVLQFFFTTSDGGTCFPIGYIPTHGLNGKFLFQSIMDMKRRFEDPSSGDPIKINWTSSDGFSSNRAFLQMMKKNHIEVKHVFDYVHLLKNIRNALLRKFPVKSPTCPTGFSMRDLDNLRKSSPKFMKLLPSSPFPTDKMDIKYIEELISEDFLDALKTEPGLELKALYEYLSNMKIFNDSFSNIDEPLEKRMNDLLLVQDYFQSIASHHKSSIPAQTLEQLCITIDSIRDLSSLETLLLTSAVSTLVVENFFSIIRQKRRYLTLWDYGCTYARAVLELVKKRTQDVGYSISNKATGKKYGNSIGITFSKSMIHLVSSAERERESKMAVQNNKSSNMENRKLDEEAAKELATECKPSVKKLLIREATCKENPLKKVSISFQSRVGCADCEASYVYPGCLLRHYRDVHDKSLEDATKLVQLATSAETFQQTRHLEFQTELFQSPETQPKEPEPLTIEYDEDAEIFVSEDKTVVFLIFYDIETTGLTDPDIIQISFYEPHSGESFARYVKPKKDIEEGAQKVHGISLQQLENEADFSEVSPEILDFIDSFRFENSDRIVLLCAYNGNKFDQPILERQFKECSYTLPEDVHFCDGLYGLISLFKFSINVAFQNLSPVP